MRKLFNEAKTRARSVLQRLFARKPWGPTPAPEPSEQTALAMPEPPRPRRKNIPGAFAQHKDHVADRGCRRVGRQLAGLVAIRTRRGLKFASREHYLRLLQKVRERPKQARRGLLQTGGAA